MTRPAVFVVGALLFGLLATANAGGYRYGVSDQAFYQPAVALTLDNTLFPRDRALLQSQMRLWAGGPALAGVTRLFGGDFALTFAAIYGVTMAGLFIAAVAFGRRLGASWWAVAALVTLLTLRHQITKTGANSVEGYMHPRMLAFACGVVTLATVLGGRWAWALACCAVAVLIHTTTGLWFSIVVAVAWTVHAGTRRVRIGAVLGALVMGAAGLGLAAGSGRLVLMDEAWLAVIADKDYLFPTRWPASAWAVNLAYAAVIAGIFRRRRRQALTTPTEPALVAGLLSLLALFLAAVPFTAAGLALAIQLQTSRIFWLLDFVAVGYVAWWLVDDLGRRWPASGRRAVVLGLLAASALRGYYVVSVEADRALVQMDLAATPWTEAMQWLRAQPPGWHVMADPSHSLVYGASIRVAAARDTPLDLGKDSAIAMYDRQTAIRVADRARAFAPFAQLTRDEVLALARRYDVDVFVDNSERQFDFPVAYRNAQFVIYRLR